jgi:hypothetical protein
MYRYIPDDMYPEASQPITENAYPITRITRDTQEFISTYTAMFKQQAGGVEFKTLKDLENDYEE